MYIVMSADLRQILLFSLTNAESPYDVRKQLARIGHVWEDNIKIFIREIVGRDSVVGIATRYGLDGPGIESRRGRGVSHPLPI
jgi:hypothetical protein